MRVLGLIADALMKIEVSLSEINQRMKRQEEENRAFLAEYARLTGHKQALVHGGSQIVSVPTVHEMRP